MPTAMAMGGWAANIYGYLSTLGDDRRIFDKVGTYVLVTREQASVRVDVCACSCACVRMCACWRVGVRVPAARMCVCVCVPMHVLVRRLGLCCSDTSIRSPTPLYVADSAVSPAGHDRLARTSNPAAN